ncbi:hypothetical protein [Bacillus wiedmannii]|uniref:hypothetical protein n=1 Tax=Bacillus wiedmannii TaxID=1890302 RepID=UPI003D20EA0E
MIDVRENEELKRLIENNPDCEIVPFSEDTVLILPRQEKMIKVIFEPPDVSDWRIL